MKKSTLREEMKKILKNLDDRWLRSASHSVGKELSALIEQQNIRRQTRGEPEITQILAWQSFFPGEIDLSRFISDQLPERSIFLPRSLSDKTMDFWSLGGNWIDHLGAGNFGILEPSGDEGEKFNPDTSAETLVLVPGLAFDHAGNRLGRGKGYYDRFFADLRLRAALKIGVCWKLQLVDAVPARDHDIPMDFIVHEDGYLSGSQTSLAHIDLIDLDTELDP
jgi:5-formyltetrahydrofolate cyclo-ligase